MEEGRLAYRVRTAEAGDAKALRDAIGSTLAHPDHQGRRESYSGAAARGDILILERGRIVEYGPRTLLASDPASHFYSLLQTGLEEVLV